jgi:hypothetical protein
MPETNTKKPATFRLGQRVLFRHRVRSALWLSGTIVGGPQSRQGQILYQAKLDNGETRWAKTNQLRRARL